MKKNLFTICLMALAMCVLMPARVMADEEIEYNDISYRLTISGNNGYAVVIGTTKQYGDIEIPRGFVYNNQDYIVTRIGNYAFSSCGYLTSVTIPDRVTSIGIGAFFGCGYLTSINFPNVLESIESWAFCGTGLTAVTIPSSVTSIGSSAFWDCWNLTSLSVERGNRVYDSRRNCNAIIETATDKLLFGCANTIITNTVKSIAEGAFSYCYNLTSVTIPSSVTSIGEGAFQGCDNLTSISVESGNTVYDSRDNCNAIIETATNTLIAGSPNTVIPNSVTIIGGCAFSGISNLKSISIPRSVTTIGNSAFEGCYGLTSVTIPNSVTTIGYYAFAYCDGLTSVTIGSGVEIIGDYAFTECTSLEDVYCHAVELPDIIGENGDPSSFVFLDSSIDAATLYVPESAIDDYWTIEPWCEFGSIEVLHGKCATPVIDIVDGKAEFTCATEDAEFVSTMTLHTSKEQANATLVLGGSAVCRISVYAAKRGYEDSDVATKDVELNFGKKGDVNGDGAVSPADAIEALYIFFGVNSSHAPQHIEPAMDPQ